jgi:hypothetical protein
MCENFAANSYVYKETQKGPVAKSYITNDSVIYMTKYLRISSYIRKPFLLSDFATAPMHLNFLIYEENFISFFISVSVKISRQTPTLIKKEN